MWLNFERCNPKCTGEIQIWELYILCIEYFGPQTTFFSSRGYANKLLTDTLHMHFKLPSSGGEVGEKTCDGVEKTKRRRQMLQYKPREPLPAFHQALALVLSFLLQSFNPSYRFAIYHFIHFLLLYTHQTKPIACQEF